MADKPDKPAPRKPLSRVPVGEAYSNLEDDKFRWQVAVPNLGGLKQGARVGAIHLQPGTDIEYHVAQGNLVPLSVEESAEASVNEHPEVPPYAVTHQLPPKPEVTRAPAQTLADAVKADDEKKAAEARHEAETKAKADADAKAKHDADEKARADAVNKAKAEMTGEKK